MSNVHPVIVVPWYQSRLSSDEITSLNCLKKHLGKHTKVVCVPQSMNVEAEEMFGGFDVVKFPDYYFKSTQSYSRLLMSRVFYKAFEDWSHMLIYQLDCLVFSDQLFEWCSRGYDYLGAPWVNKYFLENPDEGLWRAGNGGFSLRNIQSCLTILETKAYSGTLFFDGGPRPWTALDQMSELGAYKDDLPYSNEVCVDSKYISTIEIECKSYAFNEDAFWSIEASKINPNFKVIPPREALDFAIEMSPWWCYLENNRRLPFGCHAWNKYGRDFWIAVLQGSTYLPPDELLNKKTKDSPESSDDLIYKLRSQESCLEEQKIYITELENICSERLMAINELKKICSDRLEILEELKLKNKALLKEIILFERISIKLAISSILKKIKK